MSDQVLSEDYFGQKSDREQTDDDINNYKSAFARSVAINSKRSRQFDHVVNDNGANFNCLSTINSNHNKYNHTIKSVPEDSEQQNHTLANEVEVIRLRKECQSLVEENRRLNSLTNNHNHTASYNGNSSTNDLPVESFVLQSQVNTLQWQLKQTESSRLMYREVVEQMVCFLERTHRSLNLLQDRLQQCSSNGVSVVTGALTLRRQSYVPRSRSVHQVSAPTPLVPRAHSTAQIQHETSDSSNYSAFKDFTWRKPKLQDLTTDEISPEKLSQEALRLLRTAKSLLSTREPDLVHNTCSNNTIANTQQLLTDSRNDIAEEDDNVNENNVEDDDLIQKADQDFLLQLAREFPPKNTLKLIEPSGNEQPQQISTAFNRKLSVQKPTPPPSTTSKRNSLIETDFPILAPSMLTTGLEAAFAGGSNQKRNSISSNQSLATSSPSSTLTRCNPSEIMEHIKSRSPPMGSVSSAEDESGFSSMSSFQEIGLPLINSTAIELKSDKNKTAANEATFTSDKTKEKLCWLTEDVGLPMIDRDNTPSTNHLLHRRWSSNPVESAKRDPLRVLWV